MVTNSKCIAIIVIYVLIVLVIAVCLINILYSESNISYSESAYCEVQDNTCCANTIRMKHGHSCAWIDSVLYAAINHTDDPEYAVEIHKYPYSVCKYDFVEQETYELCKIIASKVLLFEDDGRIYLVAVNQTINGQSIEGTAVYSLQGEAMEQVVFLNESVYPQAINHDRLYYCDDRSVSSISLSTGVRYSCFELDNEYSRLDHLSDTSMILAHDKMFVCISTFGKYSILSVDLKTKEQTKLCDFERNWFDSSSGMYNKSFIQVSRPEFEFILLGKSIIVWDMQQMGMLSVDVLTGKSRTLMDNYCSVLQVTKKGFLAVCILKDKVESAMKTKNPIIVEQAYQEKENYYYEIDELGEVNRVFSIDRELYILERNDMTYTIKIENYSIIIERLENT